MADISKITTLDGTTYNLKDTYARQSHPPEPLVTKTYTDVIATTSNTWDGTGFFYAKVRGDTYNTIWRVKVRVTATVPTNTNYRTETTFLLVGRESGQIAFYCDNAIYSTSYRPIYYNSAFFASATGYTNGCGNWLGFSLLYSNNPADSSYKRKIVVELLEYEGCTVEMQDNLITPTNIPNRAAHTNWYSSTNTSYSNFNACDQGLKQVGDANTTSISNLVRNSGSYIVDSVVYRYQMLFQKDENTLTPLNNVSNTTGTSKTMLTDVEFNAFGFIYYYSTTSTISAAANISAGYLFFSFNALDLRYTLNCGTTLTANNPLYLIVTPTTNGKCKIASSTPWSQTLPNTNDGKWYILLGRMASTYQLALYPEHPVYYHDGTGVRQVLPPANVYTRTEIDTMLGAVETLHASI